jgi:hypothetical protein
VNLLEGFILINGGNKLNRLFSARHTKNVANKLLVKYNNFMFEPKLSQINVNVLHDPCNELHGDGKLRHGK